MKMTVEERMSAAENSYRDRFDCFSWLVLLNMAKDNLL